MGSPSFRDLWDALVNLRRRNITRDRAQQICSDNPWALTEWIPDLLEAAVARPDLDDASRNSDEPEPSLFTLPRLIWDEARPHFEVELINLADVVGDLQPGAYRVAAHNVTLAEFTIDELGTPHGLQPLHLPLLPARTTATVERGEGGDTWTVIASEQLTLWELGDEVAGFRTDGFPLDAWSNRLDQTLSYRLILAPGLELEPTPRRYVRIDDCLIVHLENDWPSDMRVLLDGEEIWSPAIAASRRRDPRRPHACRRASELGLR